MKINNSAFKSPSASASDRDSEEPYFPISGSHAELSSERPSTELDSGSRIDLRTSVDSAATVSPPLSYLPSCSPFLPSSSSPSDAPTLTKSGADPLNPHTQQDCLEGGGGGIGQRKKRKMSSSASPSVSDSESGEVVMQKEDQDMNRVEEEKNVVERSSGGGYGDARGIVGKEEEKEEKGKEGRRIRLNDGDDVFETGMETKMEEGRSIAAVDTDLEMDTSDESSAKPRETQERTNQSSDSQDRELDANYNRNQEQENDPEITTVEKDSVGSIISKETSEINSASSSPDMSPTAPASDSSTQENTIEGVLDVEMAGSDCHPIPALKGSPSFLATASEKDDADADDDDEDDDDEDFPMVSFNGKETNQAHRLEMEVGKLKHRVIPADSDFASPEAKKDDATTVSAPSPTLPSNFTQSALAQEKNDSVQKEIKEDAEVHAPFEEHWDLRMSWSGKTFDIRIEGDDRMYDVKALIFSLTSVPPGRQKLVGLTRGRTPGDETLFKELNVPHRHKFVCVGTPEKDTFKDPGLLQTLPDQLDAFDVTYGEAGSPSPADDPRNQRLIRQKVEKCSVDVMNEPRPGKKLLVLDLDYTIVDTKPLLSGALPPSECIRPGLHEFLEQVYPHYDIAVWSQTHWRWLETKLVEMGMIGDDRKNYKISFVSDSTSMFPIFGKRNGQAYKHDVKPLAFLWAKFPQWSGKNTIHIDDLSRNFALNPGEGLKIRAFKGAGTDTGLADNRLKKLGEYLLWLAANDDFTTVDHGQWKKYKHRKSGESKPKSP